MGKRKGIKLSESCVNANLRMEKCKKVKDARSRNNNAMCYIGIGLRKYVK